MSATDSQIAMLEAAIALAHADGRLEDGERAQLRHFVKGHAALTDAQREELFDKIAHPVTLDDVWSRISDLHDRAHLINIANSIFWSDGLMCHDEQEVLQRIHDAHLATIDVEAELKAVADLAENQRLERARNISEQQAEWAKKSRIERFKLYIADLLL